MPSFMAGLAKSWTCIWRAFKMGLGNGGLISELVTRPVHKHVTMQNHASH